MGGKRGLRCVSHFAILPSGGWTPGSSQISNRRLQTRHRFCFPSGALEAVTKRAWRCRHRWRTSCLSWFISSSAFIRVYLRLLYDSVLKHRPTETPTSFFVSFVVFLFVRPSFVTRPKTRKATIARAANDLQSGLARNPNATGPNAAGPQTTEGKCPPLGVPVGC